jgi:predicted methyltransferase
METREEVIVTNGGIELRSRFAPGQLLEPYPTCTHCEGKGISVAGHLQHIESTFFEISKGRPELALFFGQRVIPPSDALARVAYMHRNDDVDKKRIIFLGDDDLTSVALALRGGASRITVLDIDRRFIKYVESVAAEYDLDIESYVLDLNAILPDDLIGQFDVFVADPYPTADASFESLFWSRGINMLDTSRVGVGYTFSAPSHKPTSHFLAAQTALTEMKVVITDIIPDFCQYMTIPEELTLPEKTLLQRVTGKRTSGVSHTKSLIRFETTSDTSPLIPPDAALDLDGLSTWVKHMYRHDLVQQVGLRNQVELARGALFGNQTWNRLLDSAQATLLASNGAEDNITSKASPNLVADLLAEVFGHQVLDLDFQRLYEKSPTTVRSLAQGNGYDLRDEEAQALYLFSVGGMEALQRTELLEKSHIHQLCILARLFESYYRRPG